ncbi:MAG TPA: hypothetical protein VFQ79_24390 [Bryobacteraceae bacterium]|nr:hypothetical protein [Bryobacteraceae bacterium]
MATGFSFEEAHATRFEVPAQGRHREGYREGSGPQPRHRVAHPGVVDWFIPAGVQAGNLIGMFSETDLPFAVLENSVLEPGDAGADDDQIGALGR